MDLQNYTGPRFLLSSNKTNLAEALAGKRSATVEAEYGDEVVPGSVVTMAHHGSRAGQPSPCSYANFCEGKVDPAEVKRLELIGLSHFDLDAVGGCAALIGKKPDNESFWKLAEFQDLNGRHKVNSSNTSQEDMRRFNAFRAWSKDHSIYPDRSGSVTDVTESVLAYVDTVTRILSDDDALLKAGDQYKAKEDDLNRNSFVKVSSNGVIARTKTGDDFVNDLYVAPDGTQGNAVISFSPEKGKIVLSFADQPKGKNAIEIMTGLFGSEAGGHAGIAGTPREGTYTQVDFDRVFDAVVKEIG